jgi:hypothetical protein
MPVGEKRPGFRPPALPVRRLRHLLRTRIYQYPAIYLPFARYRYPGPSPEVIGPETELVIDGYTRSATTFAVYAFQLAQHRPVRVAHHLHAPAQLIAAARRGVPALALIREPEGAILSQLVREPHVDLRDALVAYEQFYSCLLPYRQGFVVGEFNQVTRQFGDVIRRLNQHFGTSFDEFVHNEESMRECFELIKERPTLSKTLLGFESGRVSLGELRSLQEHAGAGSQRRDTLEAWIPSPERTRSKAVLRERWLGADMADLRARAEASYREFLAG